MKVFTSHGFVTWKVWCVFVCEKKIIFQFQLMLEKEKLRNSRREGKVMHRQHTLVGFLHRGVLLYSCHDIAHKQPPWGIKCKDLHRENGAVLCSSAEPLLCSMIGVSLDHHVLAPLCLSPTRGD